MDSISDSVIYLPSSFSATDHQQRQTNERIRADENVQKSQQTVSEYIPAYPDDNDLNQRNQRHTLYSQSDEKTRSYLEFASDDSADEAKGNFVNLYV